MDVLNDQNIGKHICLDLWDLSFDVHLLFGFVYKCVLMFQKQLCHL